MRAISVSFMPHIHVVWKLQHSSKSLVKLGVLLVGQKKHVFTHYGWVVVIFFKYFLGD